MSFLFWLSFLQLSRQRLLLIQQSLTLWFLLHLLFLLLLLLLLPVRSPSRAPIIKFPWTLLLQLLLWQLLLVLLLLLRRWFPRQRLLRFLFFEHAIEYHFYKAIRNEMLRFHDIEEDCFGQFHLCTVQTASWCPPEGHEFGVRLVHRDSNEHRRARGCKSKLEIERALMPIHSPADVVED